MECHVIEAREHLGWIRRLQKGVNEMVGSTSSLGQAMVCLVNTAVAAEKAARLATEAMNEEAAASAAKATLHAQSVAWDIHDAASIASGIWIPGQMAEV